MYKHNAFTIREVARMLRLSERHVWSLVRNGTIRAVRLGRSVRIPESSLQDLLRGKEDTNA